MWRTRASGVGRGGDYGEATSVTVTELVAGVDGSPASEKALAWALHEAHRRQLAVRAVTVWQLPEIPKKLSRLRRFGPCPNCATAFSVS
jgi:Universal stress protein family